MLPTVLTPFESVTSLRSVQEKNAESLMSLTFSGTSSFVRAVCAKANSPITLRLAGSVMLFRLVQP